jgi:hypothetical protein
MVEHTTTILDRVFNSEATEPFSPLLEYLNKEGQESKQAWQCFNTNA